MANRHNLRERETNEAFIKRTQKVISVAAALLGGGILLFSNLVFGSTVTVTATVATTITCNLSTTTLAFGTLSSSAVGGTTPTNVSSSLTTNDGAGLTYSLNDAGNTSFPGLSTSSPAYIIKSPDAALDATTTLVAGTEGYGIQAATTTAGSGGTVTLLARYIQSGNTVGGLTTTTVTLASSSAAVTSREVLVIPKAAVSVSTQAASYTDTLTFSCTGN